MSHSNSSPLNTAPDEIKLAVDLIYLLESNEIEVETALAALEIVKSDLQKKCLAKDNK
ncbi:pleiotropic regulatory protein RsmS [Vibrio sp. S9_S30]|uniref:pleiotropic regulatory protein RsmS n=1 Tax=Vibrio sp. S9_S30 TaxID=2720226 RepID=UPI0016806816|nr:pleiotropic regulatory protein RsmS [Vibrio sp. S9_S30]MBD1557903.1 pleiotropic regulatory protein RsmS [Vibrio sp. S9_S30]